MRSHLVTRNRPLLGITPVSSPLVFSKESSPITSLYVLGSERGAKLTRSIPAPPCLNTVHGQDPPQILLKCAPRPSLMLNPPPSPGLRPGAWRAAATTDNCSAPSYQAGPSYRQERVHRNGGYSVGMSPYHSYQYTTSHFWSMVL